MPAWLAFSETTLWLAFAAGLLLFLGTLAVVPLIVVRIPENYFSGNHRPVSRLASLHPVLRMFLLILKNLLGLMVLLMGIAMLVLPGQGLLTMLIGLMLIDFPGKFAMEKWLVSRTLVLKSINWLRTRHNKPLLVLSPD
jgi:cytochrome c biogenesis protein CcdA